MEKKDVIFENVLYIAMSIGKWQQLTDKSELSRWTSSDWDEYYFVFEHQNLTGTMRVDFISLQDKTYVNFYKPSKVTKCGKIMWSSIWRLQFQKISLEELIRTFKIYGLYIIDDSLYSANLYSTEKEPEEINFHYQFKKSSGLYEDVFNMAYEYIKMKHNLADDNWFSTKAIDNYVSTLYEGPYKDFEDTFVKMLIDYYKDMPYHVKIRLEEYIKHNENPLCPKECIGTALVQAFIKFDYEDIHEKVYEGHI